jgi:hypothetical protein
VSEASDLISQIVDNAISISESKASEATTAANIAMAAAQAVSTTSPPSISTAIVVPNVSVDVPFTAVGPNNALYASTYAEIRDMLTNNFVNFFSTYFPNDTDYLAAAQAWILGALTIGGTGMAPAAEDQIYQRDRARILQEGERVEKEIIATWAAKGFPLPPGPALYAMYQAKKASQDLVGKSSRDVAIKQAEIEVENVRLAVKMALDYRIGAVQAAAEYIKTLALAPQIASSISIAAVNAQSNLINAASNYFRARLEVEALKLDARKTSANLQLQGQGIDVQAFTARSHNLATAASAAAQSAGQQAAAALNALHSQATLQSVENV